MQHIGMANAKFHVGGKPTQGPNANVFASQWNIGLRIDNCGRVFFCVVLLSLYVLHLHSNIIYHIKIKR